MALNKVLADSVMAGLKPSVSQAAALLKNAVEGSVPVLVRYNNDADGITSGIAVYKAIEKLMDEKGVKGGLKRRLLREKQNNSAVFFKQHAEQDLRLLQSASEKPPLIICLDFCANEESIPALELLRDAGAIVVIVDHHPFPKEVPGLCNAFVSPWSVKGGSSDYSTGLLAGELAKRLGFKQVKRLQLVSLIGDKSKLINAKRQPEGLRRAAEALDYACSRKTLAKGLEYYDSILEDDSLASRLYSEMSGLLNAAVEAAENKTRVRRLSNGFRLVVCRVDGIAKRGDYPPRGKLVTAVHERKAALFPREPVVTLGYGSGGITFRANKLARDAGFNASLLIKELRKEFSNAIPSGGGHDMAASMRVERGFAKLVFEESVKRVESV